MSALQTEQPVVVVVAESLMRVCYNEANRLANHGSNGLERMVMHSLYDAANDAKARLAAAAAKSDSAPDERGTRSLERMVRELEKRWARRLMEKCGPTRDAMECGQVLQLKECLDELRAEMAKLPNAGDERLRERE